jgi:hypothetical protein
MTEKLYACIENNNVVNVIVFDDPTEDLVNSIKNNLQIDDIVEATDKTIIGGTYDGSKFWTIQPFASWLKNEETNEWVAPILPPQDGGVYRWNETNLNWETYD